MSIHNSEYKPKTSQKQEIHKSLIKSTSILSLGTFSSRILGFLRDILLANLFGTSVSADAFFAALKIPNLLRSFVGEGAVNSSVVPVFSQYLETKKKEDLWELVNVVFAIALVGLSLLTIVGVLFAPLIVRVLVPGFISDPEKFYLTVKLTRIIFPYLIFIGLTTYSMGVLFTFKSFLTPAFIPCFFNLALIGGALSASKNMDEPVFGVAISVLVGGILQILVQLKPLWKTGFRFKKPKTFKHPGAKQIGKLLGPRVFGSAVYQFTVLIDTFCASLSGIVGLGGIAAIHYATRIIQFPTGVFGISLSNAALPRLSALSAREDMEQFKKTLIFGLENMFFVMCPITVMMLVFSTQIIKVLFQRGEFGEYSTAITSSALLFYAIGLFAFTGVRMIVTAFHALQDTKTPVKVAALCLVINAVFNVILMFPMKIAGIAFASSISQIVNLLVLLFLINKRLNGLHWEDRRFFMKVSCAAFASGSVMLWSWNILPVSFLFLRLIITLSIGVLAHFVFCYFLKVKQVKQVIQWVQNKSHE